MKKAAIAIIYSENKSKVLVVKRRDVPIWVLPGGGIETGESHVEAVAREVEEEAGIKATITRKAAIYIPISRLGTYTEVFEGFSNHLFPCCSDETIAAGFYPVDALPEPFFHVHRHWIEETRKEPGKLITRPLFEVTYMALLKYFLRHPLRVLRFFFSRIGFPINAKG